MIGKVLNDIGRTNFRLITTLARIGNCILLFCFGGFLLLSVPAQANESQSEPALESRLVIDEFRIAGDEHRMRILLYFDKKPDFSWFLLRNPYRLVLDLPDTLFAIAEEDFEARGFVSQVNYGKMTEQQSRIIVSFIEPFTIESMELYENDNSQGYRLIIDLVSDSEDAFEAELRKRLNEATSATLGAKASIKSETTPQDERFTIVLDPGHGGIDGGARGASGTYEKNVTLAFAKELEVKLSKNKRYRIVLTRDQDVFLRLEERVKIARENNADLLISIHADSIKIKGFRGATVYTLSEQASDIEAAETAARENLSDELAGVVTQHSGSDIADILVDLMKRETHGFSYHFARTLVSEISNSLQLVNNPLRSAGFRVLGAHDVPSALLELGYLSNLEDEKLLNDKSWREEVADGVVRSITKFADSKAKLR